MKPAALTLLSLCLIAFANLSAQQAATDSPPSRKDGLLLAAPTRHDPLGLTVDELKSMKHVTVKVRNAHTDRDETHDGLRLVDLLSKMGTPLGTQMRGKALSNYVVATGADGYTTVLAVAEVDPEFHLARCWLPMRWMGNRWMRIPAR